MNERLLGRRKLSEVEMRGGGRVFEADRVLNREEEVL